MRWTRIPRRRCFGSSATRSGLTGTKFSCGIGQCGACTVHVDGAPVRSCSFPLAAAAGKSITTIEGVSRDGSHPIQVAWKELDAPQCGYCQSGMIMSTLALLTRNPAPTDADIDAARHERLPLQQLSPRPQGDPPRRRAHEGERRPRMTARGDSTASPRRAPTALDRREFLAAAAAGSAAFVLGFWVPAKASAANTPGAVWYEDPAVPEINGWIVIGPDDTVTIRIAQTELGQGVWTSNAMMVAEELQCDWAKVVLAVRFGQS